MKKLRPLLQKMRAETAGGRPKRRDDTAAYRASPPGGAVADRATGTAGGKSGWVLLNERDVDSAFLERHEHYVFGVWCLPADLAIGLSIDALSASTAGSTISLCDLEFVEPLIVRGSKTIRLRIEQSTDPAQAHVRMVSLAPGQSSPVVHFRSAYRLVGEQSMVALKEQTQTWIPELGTGRSCGEPIRLNGITSAIRLGRGYGSLALTGSHKASHSGLLIRDESVKNGSAWSDVQTVGACFTALISTEEGIERQRRSSATFLPVRIDKVHVLCVSDATELTVRWRLREQSAGHLLLADIVVCEGDNRPVFAMEGVQLFRTDRSRFLQRAGVIKDGAGNTGGTGHGQRRSSARPDTPSVQKQIDRESTDKREAVTEVAVIGMSGLFPGAANTDEFWQNLCDAKNAITEVPSNRWREFSDWYDPDPEHQGTSSSNVGGFVDKIDRFDHNYFKISKADAELMDPHQRLMLQEAIRALDNAALTSDHFDGSACGVFIGGTRGDYDRVLDSVGLYQEGKAFTGTSASLMASNIAYHLNLGGPTVVVDTACSSSLTAVHFACASIDRGECELAVVGGVNLFLSPIAHIHTSQVGMQSAQGECRTFDAAADGTVFSEACAAVVLKRLDAARRDGDPILATISGSGINQDGKTNGITAPSSLTQARLMRQVLERSSLQRFQVGYVEAHGTATPLGDPIEVKALAEVYGGLEGDPESCLVGSVKSNIGHCSYAAGIVGLIKCVLCLKHEKVPPSLHFTEPNKRIDFSSTRFEVSRRLQPWRDAELSRRYCAVSSFGFGGSNAHAVLCSATGRLDEKPVSTTENGAAKAFYIPVSAESFAGLGGAMFELGRYLHARIAENGHFVERDLSIANIAYTLEHRRRSRCAYRALFKADSIAALADTLITQAIGDLAETAANVWVSESVRRDSGIDAEIARESVDTYRDRLTPDQFAWISRQPDACGLNKYPAGVVALNLPGYCFEEVTVWPVPAEPVGEKTARGTAISSPDRARPDQKLDKPADVSPPRLRTDEEGLDTSGFLTLVGGVLKADPETLHLDLQIKDLGIDSINVKSLVREINTRHATEFRVASFFSCKSLRALYELVDAELRVGMRTGHPAQKEKAPLTEPKPQQRVNGIAPPFDESEIRKSRFYDSTYLTAPAEEPRVENNGKIWSAVKDVIAEILMDVDPAQIGPETQLRELGANSVDRMEVVTTSMERLSIRVPQTRFSQVRNVGDLVDVLAGHESSPAQSTSHACA